MIDLLVLRQLQKTALRTMRLPIPALPSKLPNWSTRRGLLNAFSTWNAGWSGAVQSMKAAAGTPCWRASRMSRQTKA